MKTKTIMSLVTVAMLSLSLSGQTYPLSENSWSNPEFVERFLGSYGILTEKEPQITTEESEVFQEIGTLMEANNAAGAIKVLKSAQSAEGSAAIDYTLGNVYLQQGQFAEGIKAYEVAIKKFPNFLRAYKNTSLAYVQLQNYQKAAEYLAKSMELGDASGDSYGLLGYCYLNMDMSDAALDAYRIAGVLSPRNKDWKVGKATALQRIGLYEESVAKFDELIALYPKTKAFYTAAANACISLGDQMKATKYLELLRRSKVGDNMAMMLLGDIYLNEKLFGLAVDVYSGVLPNAKRSDAERVVRFTRGLVAYGAYDDSLAFMDKIDSSPLKSSTEQNLLNLRSQVALAMGDSEAAVASLEKVIEKDPLNGEALILLGNYYSDKDDQETAIFYFERAQKIDSHSVEGFVQAARVKVSQGQFVEAISLLQQAQSIKPQAHVENYLKAVRNALKAS